MQGAVPKSPNRQTVAFTTRIVAGSASVLPIVFDARYDDPAGAAHFRITLSDRLATFGAERDSKPRPLLLALQRSLGARRFPSHPQRVARLEVASVILGYKPSTGWASTKLLFGNRDEGELYLNVNLKTGIGQFVLVDARYGNYVLAQLAQVL